MRHVWLFQGLIPLLLTGCLGKPTELSLPPGELEVFGIALDAATDHREIMGVRGVDEPCLRGFERSFDPLEIVIGYDRNGRIRKLTTRNPQTAMFGIHPGAAAAPALVKLRNAGFLDTATPYRFRKETLFLTVLVDSNGQLFGMTLETGTPTDP